MVSNIIWILSGKNIGIGTPRGSNFSFSSSRFSSQRRSISSKNILFILIEINATINMSSTGKTVEVSLCELDEIIFIYLKGTKFIVNLLVDKYHQDKMNWKFMRNYLSVGFWAEGSAHSGVLYLMPQAFKNIWRLG